MYQLMLKILRFLSRRDFSHACYIFIFLFLYFYLLHFSAFLPAGSVIRRARKMEEKNKKGGKSSSWVFQF